MTMTPVRWKRRSPWRCLMIGILTLGLCMGGVPAWAGPKTHRQEKHYPDHGKIRKHIPRDHHTVRKGRDSYHYHEGVFYHRVPRGYKVVRPPRGLVVHRLPSGFETLIIAGVAYLVFAGVYYQRTPSGYVVVEAPHEDCGPEVVMSEEEGQILAVNVPILNVRSGPGMHHPVICHARPGDRLVILGSSPGWFYVRLPYRDFGWVMSRHTRVLGPDAKG